MSVKIGLAPPEGQSIVSLKPTSSPDALLRKDMVALRDGVCTWIVARALKELPFNKDDLTQCRSEVKRAINFHFFSPFEAESKQNKKICVVCNWVKGVLHRPCNILGKIDGFAEKEWECRACCERLSKYYDLAIKEFSDEIHRTPELATEMKYCISERREALGRFDSLPGFLPGDLMLSSAKESSKKRKREISISSESKEEIICAKCKATYSSAKKMQKSVSGNCKRTFRRLGPELKDGSFYQGQPLCEGCYKSVRHEAKILADLRQHLDLFQSQVEVRPFSITGS